MLEYGTEYGKEASVITKAENIRWTVKEAVEGNY
jgi:hypothetical protein